MLLVVVAVVVFFTASKEKGQSPQNHRLLSDSFADFFSGVVFLCSSDFSGF